MNKTQLVSQLMRKLSKDQLREIVRQHIENVSVQQVEAPQQKEDFRQKEELFADIADMNKDLRPERPSEQAMRLAEEETAKLLGEGKSFEEIAQKRGRQVSSVLSLVADLVERGEIAFQPGWICADHQRQIAEACARLGMERLKPIKDALPEEVSYGEIRLVVAHLRRETSVGQQN